MTNVLDGAADFATAALDGFCRLHPDLVCPVRGGAIRAAAPQVSRPATSQGRRFGAPGGRDARVRR